MVCKNYAIFLVTFLAAFSTVPLHGYKIVLKRKAETPLRATSTLERVGTAALKCAAAAGLIAATVLCAKNFPEVKWSVTLPLVGYTTTHYFWEPNLWNPWTGIQTPVVGPVITYTF